MFENTAHLLKKCQKISDNLFVKSHIPEKKLKNAAEAMNVDASHVEMLFDNTLFGSASDGFVITKHKFVFKSLWSDPVEVKFIEIERAGYHKEGKKERLQFYKCNGDLVEIDDLVSCDYRKLSDLCKHVLADFVSRKKREDAELEKRAREVNAEQISKKTKKVEKSEKKNEKSKVEADVEPKPKKTTAIAPDEYVVAVVAPMSSGKSTTLNAMLGVTLLPCKNQACTAIPTKITDVDGLTDFTVRTIGPDGHASPWQALSIGGSQMSDWNEGPFQAVEIQGDFPNIDNHTKRIVFLDTPGPNNSTNLAHGEITHNLLSEGAFTFLMFVLNATQFGVQDERTLLKKVAKWIKEDGDHSSLVFLVNKIDALDIEKGECPERHVDSVRDYLEELGFIDPVVIPVMSKLSLELRMCLSAHSAKMEVPFSSRIQARIADDLAYVLEERERFRSALQPILKEQGEWLHQGDTGEVVRIAQQEFTYQDIAEAEILTGIPILERCLQAKLAAHPDPVPAGIESNPSLVLNKLPSMSMNTYDVKISYNPYTVKTTIEVNGKPHSALMDQVRNRRLSQWIDRLIPEIFEQLNTQEIGLTFEGTVLDGEDVRDAIDLFCAQRSDLSLEVAYVTCERSVDDRVNAIKALFEEAQKGPIDDFRSPAMRVAYNRAFQPELEVNVLATMSAGKSTLINAMLGLELMPSKNEACTATIAEIHDYDDMEVFEAKRYDHDDQLQDDWTVVFDPSSTEAPKRPTLLKEWNNDKETSRIEVCGDIPAIKEREQVRLVLVDTPGPNNSRDASHREATIRAITSSRPSMVLYVLNAQNLGVEDDRSLLAIIKKTMEEGGRDAQDRFIFVANKIDVFDPEKGEKVSDALVNVKSYLNENGIENPLVIPASAELTMMLRTQRARGKEALTRSQRGRLLTSSDLFLEEEEMNLLEHVKNDIGQQAYMTLKEQAEQGDDLKKVEIRSGVPILEQLLENYISKHALPVRLKDVVDSFSAVAREVKQVQALSEIIQKSENELAEIKGLVEGFNKDRARLQKAKDFKDRVKAEKLKLSKANKATLAEVETLYYAMVGILDEEFGKDLSLSEAIEKITNRSQQAEMFVDHIKVLFEDNLKVDVLARLNSLREEYQAYVAEVLNKSFPADVSDAALSFQSAILEMKSVETMIMEGDISVISQESTWYNPLSWFREDKVSSQEVLESFQACLRTALDRNRVAFEKALEDNFASIKAQLLKEMDEIDERVQQTFRELEACESSREEKEKKIRRSQEIIDWYESFQRTLSQVLELTPSAQNAIEKTERV